MYLKWYKYKDLFPIIKNRSIIVFGAGYYGQRLICRLIKDGINKFLIYDNDERKWETAVFGMKITKFPNSKELPEHAVYLIVGKEKIANSSARKIFEFLRKYVDKNKIYMIKEESLATLPKAIMIYNSEQYVNEVIEKSKVYKREKINTIRSLTYRPINISKLGTTGGPGKILHTEALLLGDKYKDITLLYNYKECENEVSIDLDYACSNILGAVEFAKQISSEDENTAYISHDIFSAAGLAANGKKYILVYHNQGEIVYEMEKFGHKFDIKEKELIYKLENFSLKNAVRVIFPSKGAEYFFRKTCGSTYFKYIGGEAAYNTLLSDNMKKSICVPGINENDEYVTFFSIGQMTESKGIDRIPEFLVGLSKHVIKQIRWVVVANGVLKEKIVNKMENICFNNDKITFAQYDFMTHEQINYMFSISDVYIMLHRVSIFDLATLEAMYHDLKIILSDIPGNREYNISDNVFLVNNEIDYKILARELHESRKCNRKVYDEIFSNEAFVNRYKRIIDELASD